MTFLKAHLLQTSETNTDFYLTKETIEGLRDSGVDTQLYGILKRALRGKKHVEITWRPLNSSDRDVERE